VASPKVIAAAQAAASWARARRATWTTVPLPRPVTPATAAPIVQPFGEVLEPEPVEIETVVFPTRPVLAPAPRPVEKTRGSANPWVARGAIAAGVLVPIALAAAYAMRGGFSTLRRSGAATASSTAGPNAPPATTTGVLKVTSTPEGARVVVDGRDRGVTPLSIDDISLGAHLVAIEAKNGSVERSVMVTANRVAQLDEQIFDGWVAVFSPVELVISESGRVLRPDDHNEIMLSPGTHRLRFTNTKLAYDETKSIVIKPGERNAYSVRPPQSSVSVTASAPAEVFLDGAKIGDTPLNAVPATIGTHDLVVKPASGSQKRMAITVTVKPFAVNVDF
jgi:PEGA domain